MNSQADICRFLTFSPVSAEQETAQHCRVKRSKYTALVRQLNCHSRWFKSSSEKQARGAAPSAVREVKGQRCRETERETGRGHEAKKQDVCTHW